MLPYTHHTLDERDIAAVVEVLHGNWLTQGPKIAQFEAALAERVGARHAVVVSSGTAALHLACLAAQLGPGNEIITSPITFAASGNAARYVGAEVRFADIRPDIYCVDPKVIEAAITPRTKVLIPVDFAGQPCDLEPIMTLADKHGLTVIEDAAHALGATYRGRPVGAIAHMTVFSFHPAKHVAMGEGGAVMTDDDALAARLRLLRTHGITSDDAAMRIAEQAAEGSSVGKRAPWYYEMQTLGFNYRTTDISSALGLSQLGKLDASLERRHVIATRYSIAFAGSNLIAAPHQEADRESAWHLYVVRLNLAILAKSRRQIFDELRGHGIGVHVHYIPLHLQPYYRDRYGHRRGDFPVAEAYYDSCLTLPLFPSMSDGDVEMVIDRVLETVR
jgi:perosamine synthetase